MNLPVQPAYLGLWQPLGTNEVISLDPHSPILRSLDCLPRSSLPQTPRDVSETPSVPWILKMVLSGLHARRSGRSLGPCNLNNHSHPDSPWGRDAHGVGGTRRAQQLLGWGWKQLCLLATAACAQELGEPTGYHVLPSAVPELEGQAPAVPKGTAACSAICSYWSQPSGSTYLN